MRRSKIRAIRRARRIRSAVRRRRRLGRRRLMRGGYLY